MDDDLVSRWKVVLNPGAFERVFYPLTKEEIWKLTEKTSWPWLLFFRYRRDNGQLAEELVDHDDPILEDDDRPLAIP